MQQTTQQQGGQRSMDTAKTKRATDRTGPGGGDGKKRPAASGGEWQQSLFESITDAVFIHAITADGVPGAFIEVNDAACRSTGYSREELLTMTPLDLSVPDDSLDMRAVAEKLLAGGSASFEQKGKTKDGRIIPVRVHTHVISLSCGRCAIAVTRDLTVEKELEKKLSASRALAEKLTREPVSHFMLLDRAGAIHAINERGAKHFGRDPREIIGLCVFDLVPPAIAEGRRERVDTVFRTGREIWFEERRGDTHVVHTFQPVVDGAGAVQQVAAFARDVTGIDLCGDSLAEVFGEARGFDSLIAPAGPMVFRSRAAEGFPIVYVSRNVAQLGYRAEDFLSGRLMWKDFVSAEDRQKNEPQAASYARQGIDSFTIEFRIADSRGATRWVKDFVRLLRDGEGRPAFYENVLHDITEQKEREKSLEECRELAEAVLNGPVETAALLDREGTVLAANDATALRLGVTLSALLGTSLFGYSRSSPGVVARRREKVEEVFRTGMSLQFEDEREGRLLMHSFHPVRDGSGAVRNVAVFSRDVLRERKSEQAVAEAIDRARELEAIINRSSSMVFRVGQGPEFPYLYVSGNVSRLGFSVEELLSGPRRWMDFIHPDDIERVRGEGERLIEEGVTEYTQEFRVMLQDGTVRWMSALVKLVAGADGEPLYYDAILHDVTGRRNAEELLRESLKEKEMLLHEVVHRVKNNLQMVSSVLMLQKCSRNDGHTCRVVDDSLRRIAAISLVHDMLYSSDAFSLVDLGKYIGDVVRLLQATNADAARSVNVELDIDEVRVQADDAVFLGLVVNELFTNAVKHAFPGGRKGAIRICARPTGEKHLQVVFADDGVGIDEAVALPPRDSLGLRIVHTLVEGQMKGAIALDRTRGTSWTFAVALQ